MIANGIQALKKSWIVFGWQTYGMQKSTNL